MVKATIESRTGAVITVEGTEAEVAKVLADYERSNASNTEQRASAEPKLDSRSRHKRPGVSELILSLRESGFFDQPKTLSETETALSERGCLKPATTLSGVMLKLVKKRDLQRKRSEGRWVYGK